MCKNRLKPRSTAAAPADVAYDEDSSVARNRNALPPRSIRQFTVLVSADVCDGNEIRQRATAARLAGIVEHPIQRDSIPNMLAGALAAASDRSLDNPLLASCGIAILPRNDSPTLYDGHESLRVYVPPGHVLARNEAVAGVICGSPADMLKISQPVKLTDGSTIDLKPFADLLPIEQSITVPGNVATIVFAANLRGQTVELKVPAEIAAHPEADLARSAKATASSSETGYSPAGAIDGVADGYPNDKRHEWSSNHETENAAITLTWKSPQNISHVVLYDRPNLDDQILAGQIVF